MSERSEPITAAIWGASGATGCELLRRCLADSRVGEVRAFVRRALDVEDGGLKQVVVENFLARESYAGELDGVDVAFWCLGVSQSAVRDEARYREITVDYTLAAAFGLLEANPRAAFHFVSAMGAAGAEDQSGKRRLRPMWARVKGEAELALQGAGFRRLIIWRPGYIGVPGGRAKPTGFERLWEIVSPLFRVVPNLVNPTPEIARAMLAEALGNADATGCDLRLAKDILRMAKECREDEG